MIADLQLMEMNGELDRGRVLKWLQDLGDSDMPVAYESQLVLDHLTPNQSALMLTALRAYRSILEPKGDCPPEASTGVLHHIDTGNHAPLRLKRRRYEVAEEEVIATEVETMLKNGVIEPGRCFPAVLVRKKDGPVRFCIDYRALNDITKRDVYPLPRIDETIQVLQGAEWFSTLDLHAGY